MENEKQEWWQMLDWSMMGNTYNELNDELKEKVKREGYWSLGIEVYEKKVIK